MKLNLVSPGIRLLGTSIKELIVENNIVDLMQDEKRSFSININDPVFHTFKDEKYAKISIDIEIEIKQMDESMCKIKLSIEGAFLSEGVQEDFANLVMINGAAALIGIARGKIESITGNIFNNGKVIIPFINVLDYYSSNID